MWRTFELRVCKASWGIAIDLTAWSVELPEPPAGSLRAGDRTWLEVSQVDLPRDAVDQLLYGLSIVAPLIETVRPERHVLVDVIEVQHMPGGYQAEGLAVAIIGWTAEEFDFQPPTIRVGFDQGANRYVFR
jgi:hypothetical protein